MKVELALEEQARVRPWEAASQLRGKRQGLRGPQYCSREETLLSIYFMVDVRVLRDNLTFSKDAGLRVRRDHSVDDSSIPPGSRDESAAQTILSLP